MHFSSDNASGVAPEIMAALAAANEGPAWGYGADAITRRLDAQFSELFEREVSVFPVSTGTAANSLILAQMTPPWGAVLCHSDSHINTDECGAPEMFMGGAKLVGIGGPDGKLTVEGVRETLGRFPRGMEHRMQASALSLTQATEWGSVYQADDVRALADLAHEAGLKVHMDGARFANALVALGLSPAEATWKLGVDALAFGATKNGAMAAEAVVFFDPALVENFKYRRKRVGHMFSKMRYLSAQLEAYIADGLWLRLAGHANAAAQRLKSGIEGRNDVTILNPVDTNELFLELRNRDAVTRLRKEGAAFVPWDASGQRIRLVTSFQTTDAEIDAFLAALDRVL